MMTDHLLVRLVPNEGDNHAVQVEKEHDKVEAKLDEGFLREHESVRKQETSFATRHDSNTPSCARSAS